MRDEFVPRLDVLAEPQRRLWAELAAVPAEFVLYGGTAIALHLGHRRSEDFDFFGNRPFDPAGLAAAQAMYGAPFNPEITLKALSFFDDGNLRRLPQVMKDRLAKAAREVDLDRLPATVPVRPS